MGVGLLALYSRNLLHELTAFTSYRDWAVFAFGWAVLSIFAVLVLFFFKPRFYKPLASIIIVADSFLMFAIPFLSVPKMAAIDYSPIHFLQNNLGYSRFYTLGPISPNYGSYFDIASININDLPIPEKYSEHIEDKLDENSVPILFTGFTREDPNGPTAIEELGNNISEYENLSVKYIVAGRNQLDEQFVADKKLTKVFESELMQIYSLPNTKSYFEVKEGNCSISERTRDNIEIDCPQDTSLVRRELSMPGWQASVNGKESKVETADNIFQEIKIPKGKSEVRYTYNPPHIIYGYIFFIVGILTIAVGYLKRI